MKPRDVELVIDRLVLDGLDGVDGRRLAPAIERELGRLVRERGLPPGLAGGARDAVRAPAVRIREGLPPARIAAAVARSLWSGLGASGAAASRSGPEGARAAPAASPPASTSTGGPPAPAASRGGGRT